MIQWAWCICSYLQSYSARICIVWSFVFVSLPFCLSQRFRQKVAGRPVLRNLVGHYSEPHVFISAHISPMAGSGLFCHSKYYVLGGPAALRALGTRGVRFVFGIGPVCIQHRTLTEITIPVSCLRVFLECGGLFFSIEALDAFVSVLAALTTFLFYFTIGITIFLTNLPFTNLLTIPEYIYIYIYICIYI